MELIKKINQYTRVFLIKGKQVKISKGKYQGFDDAIADYLTDNYNITTSLAFKWLYSWITNDNLARQGIYNK